MTILAKRHEWRCHEFCRVNVGREGDGLAPASDSADLSITKVINGAPTLTCAAAELTTDAQRSWTLSVHVSSSLFHPFGQSETVAPSRVQSVHTSLTALA